MAHLFLYIHNLGVTATIRLYPLFAKHKNNRLVPARPLFLRSLGRSQLAENKAQDISWRTPFTNSFGTIYAR